MTGCPEDLSSDDLTVVNDGPEPVTVDFVYFDAVQLSDYTARGGPIDLDVGEAMFVSPFYDARRCVQADLVAEKDGVEVDRVEGPICVPDDGLTIRVGSEDDDGG